MLIAMTSGAAGSTGSSDIVWPVDSPLTLAMPIQPLLSFLETGRQPWVPWGVAAGLAGLGPGPHSDGHAGALSQTGSHVTRLRNL